MFIYPSINPIAFHLGPIKVHWYGIMYLVGFLLGGFLALRRSQLPYYSDWTRDQIFDLVFYMALSLIIGGRLGYMLFYGWDLIKVDPWVVFKIWQGGMSFHGGLLGSLVGIGLFAHRYQKSFFVVSDFVAPFVPLGLAAGRIGNFINGELWGSVTSMPWGMVFPQVDNLPRHPSQIYECLLEGFLLFIILWCYSNKPRPTRCVSGLFLLGYGVFRIFCEFFRAPDVQLGYIAWHWLTMGQLLSLPMVTLGLIFLVLGYYEEGLYKLSAVKY